MRNKISHSGVVDSIEDGCVHVRIVQTAACAACKAASYCNASESKEKVVDVFCDTSAHHYAVGQSVTVMASSQAAGHALLLAFGLPFVILVGVLFAVKLLTASELVAATVGLLSLVPYYGVIYLVRDRIRDKISFWIEE